MTLKIEIFGTPDHGPLAEQIDEAMAAIGFTRRIDVLKGTTAVVVREPLTGLGSGEVGMLQEGQAAKSETQSAVTETQARERGKPAPGKARRTKEEIAEDEAADAADQAANDTSEPETKSQISTGGERVGPEDTVEDEDQDKADEKAEVEDTRKELTRDDVKAAMTQYVNTYGLPATQEDGPKLIGSALGKPPEGEDYWKLSLIPEDPEKLAKVVNVFQTALSQNPYKRDKV
jgi:hypothetical protein